MKQDKPWTDEDVNYLLEHASEFTAKEIGWALKRTEDAVHAKARRLKIYMKYKEPTYLSALQVMRTLRIGQNKLAFFTPTRKRGVERTIYDVEHIVKVVAENPDVDLYAYELGTLGAFETPEFVKAVTTSKNRREERKNIIREVLKQYTMGTSQKAIAENTGLTINQVCAVIASHGDGKSRVKHSWTTGEEKMLLDGISIDVVAQQLKLPRRAVARKAGHLLKRLEETV